MAKYDYESQDRAERVTLSSVIGRYSERVESELVKLMKSDTKLGEAAAEAVLKGGKRLRPSLALLACQAVSGSYEAAVPVAIAYELAHSASLTQDDVIDESDLRRGAKTIQSKYGTTNAILVSDVLLFKIFEVLGTYQSIPISKARLATILSQLGGAARMAAEGEFLEMVLAAKQHPTEADYVSSAGLKTGSLFAASAASGAIAGRADKRTVSDLYEYGYHLGISFQVVDDILDITGESSETGKPTFKDLQNDAANIVLYHALESADNYKRSILRSMLWKKTYGIADVQSMMTIFEETGSIEYARRLSSTHSSIARERLGRLRDTPAREGLRRLTEALEYRKQ